MPDLTEDEIAQHRFRHLHRRSSSSTTCAGSRSTAPTPTCASCWSRRASTTMHVDARQGRALRADLRPPGLQGRRQVQVLGRADGRGLGRRPGPGRQRTRRRRRKRGIEIRYGARAHLARPRRRCAVTACASSTTASTTRSRARRGRAGLRRLRGQRRMAHALSRARAGISPRCAARASTPATASAWRSTSAPRRTATGRAATRSAGTATRRNSATSRSATASRSTPIRSASWSTPTASASSTRAPTSATTPTPNTAASSWSSRASSPGRSSTARCTHLLRDEYRIKQVTKVTADTLEELRRQARRRRSQRASSTRSRRYNAAVRPTCRSIPTSRTGAARAGSRSPKSNWANTHRRAALRGLPGRLRHHLHLRRPARSTPRRRRCSTPTCAPIPGLYAAGELVGGLFYFNYPGGTGLMSGAVFGRIAGAAAAGSQRL